MVLEIGDIVLCTVDRIIGTTVFVKIDREKREGSIILSEVAPGRIRNLRKHVVPKKKIVCKVLRISKDRIDLSLRRVTQKEKKEIIEQDKQEKSYKSILKSVLKEKSNDIIKKIQEESKLYDFFEEEKENPKELKKLTGKEASNKILEIIKTQKTKKAILKKEINLRTTNPKGLELIKKLFQKIKNAKITYVSAGKYLIKVESDDVKKADNLLKNILKEIEKKAKEQEIEFI